MTKVRTPLSIENTLRVVLGELTIEVAAEITSRGTAYLNQCTDEDRREQLNVRDLELLDLEHHARFGRGFPLYQALGRRLDTARSERFADAAANGRNAALLAKESGEAIAALCQAAFAAGDEDALRHALAEMEQAHTASTTAIADLRDQLERARNASHDTS